MKEIVIIWSNIKISLTVADLQLVCLPLTQNQVLLLSLLSSVFIALRKNTRFLFTSLITPLPLPLQTSFANQEKVQENIAYFYLYSSTYIVIYLIFLSNSPYIGNENVKMRYMEQFAKGFFIAFYLKLIGSIFVLFSVDVTSIDVAELPGLSENNQKKIFKIAHFQKIFAKE